MENMNYEKMQLFEDQEIRSAWDEENGEWYFAIIDVVGILTESKNYETARNYWKVTKHRLIKEGNETVTNCNQLKLKAADGKRRLTDVANTEQLLRIIQSIPSKKAEPFKLWLAQIGRERMEETMDPELIADRLIATYERKGYTREWINQRLQAISARKELGHSVITSQNAIQLNHIVEAMIEISAKTSEQDKSSNGEENGQ